MTAFFIDDGIAPIGVQRLFFGPSTKGRFFRFQSLTTTTYDLRGSFSGATEGRNRSEAPVHADHSMRSPPHDRRTSRTVRPRRIPPLYTPRGGAIRGGRSPRPSPRLPGRGRLSAGSPSTFPGSSRPSCP